MEIIKNDKIEVKVDSKGAQLQSVLYENREYLWQGDKLYWGGRAPILFPIVGGLRNNLTVIEGKIYSMKRHGFARASQYFVSEKTEDSVTYLIKSTDYTRAVYPYEFEFYVKHSVKDNTLTTQYTVVNTGDKVMPFAMGGHPAINCPLNKDEAFEDYVIEFPENENAQCPTVSMETGLIDFNNRYPCLDNGNTIKLSHRLFDADAMIFDTLKSRSCKLYSKKSGNGVKISFDGYDMFGVWSAVNDAPFICLEPWTGCATAFDEDDMFESKRNLIRLAPGEKCVKQFTLELF